MILRCLNLAFIPDVNTYLMTAVLSANIIANTDLDISPDYIFRLPSRSLRSIYRCSISFIASNYPMYSASVDKIAIVGSITQVILANNALNEFTRALELQPDYYVGRDWRGQRKAASFLDRNSPGPELGGGKKRV